MSLKKMLTAKVIYPLTRLFVFMRSLFFLFIGKKTLGVRAIVVSEDQCVLLVKHTYQPGWYLPGGGVKRGESLTEAITRELYEEAGIQLLETPQLFATYVAGKHGALDYPSVFIVHRYQQIPMKSLEISEIQWVALQQLPADVTPATRRRLSEFFEGKAIETAW